VAALAEPEAAVGERWRESWDLAGKPAPALQLRQLAHRYAERHRAYHNLRHVLDCLDLAASVRSQLEAPARVELALWYHDAIYDPRAADNEERSAALAAEDLDSLPASSVRSIGALILATKHQAVPETPDAAFVVDIDLAILAAPTARFDAYESAIRREYRWVPGPLFRRKRRELLQAFLGRPAIYHTPHFRSQLEARARVNLSRSMTQLS
jgi:predicted metal-dependent HD superfamily phosphohydrolase